MSEARCIWPVRAILGEGPLWSAREQAIYFVDIKKPALHRYSPRGRRAKNLGHARADWLGVIPARQQAGLHRGL